MKLVKFEKRARGSTTPLFINPKMVVAVEDETTYMQDSDGTLKPCDGKYRTLIYVSNGWGCTVPTHFDVAEKYTEVIAMLEDE